MTDVIRVEGIGKISLFDLVDRLSGKVKKLNDVWSFFIIKKFFHA